MGFIFACWAIVVILVLMMVIFMRSDRKQYAIAIIPLIILPLVHIFSRIISLPIATITPLNRDEIRIIVNVVAGLVSCLLLGVSTRGVEGKTSRRAMFVVCSAFILILTIALVANMINIA